MGNAVVRVNGHAYENQGVLAEGGFATVCRVRRGDAQFALKWTRGIGDDAQLQRMLLEIQVQRKLQHPNTMRLVEAEVRVSDSGVGSRGSSPAKPGAEWASAQRTKEVLMVFPLYTRGTLQQHIEHCYEQQIPAFTERDCLRIFLLIAESVLELQARGYAHRDIKPHNVLLTSSDPMEPVLTDFGSIYPVKTSITSAHEALELFEDAAQYCSAAYRAPELWESHSSTSLRGVLDSGRADVWSLGCVLYAMAFGPFSPFESPTQGVLHLAIFSGTVRFPPNYARFGQTHSAAFVGLIQWMLNVSAQERPTIYQVLDRVDELYAGRSRSRTTSRSASLRRAYSTKQPSLRTQKSSDWADFSAFQNDVDSDAASPQSDLTMASVSSSSAVSRTSSWNIVSRHASVAGDDTMSLKSNAYSTSTKDDEFTATTDQRRKLSIQGRHLLATALAS